MNTIEKLTDMKQKIDKAKNKKAELEGEVKSILKSIKEDYGIDNVDDAKNEIKKLEENIKTLEVKKNKLISEIEFEWDENDLDELLED